MPSPVPVLSFALALPYPVRRVGSDALADHMAARGDADAAAAAAVQYEEEQEEGAERT